MHNIYLLLGSNLGDREDYLNRATVAIEIQVGNLVKASSRYQTKAWGNTDQPDFINQVLHVRSNLEPDNVLLNILLIEKQLGREREEKWGARFIDIDILFYDDRIINRAELIIPHPHFQNRRFAVAPMLEIAPDFRHPALNKTIKSIALELRDELTVQNLNQKNAMTDETKKGFSIDMSYLNEIAGGSEEFMIEMIDIFIDQTPLYFDQLNKAIQSCEWKTVADVAHKIKPTLAFMGINEAKDIMAEIERKARNVENTSEIPGMFNDINNKCSELYSSLDTIREELKAKL